MPASKRRLLYIGGLSADEKGAVGTHTSGILKAMDKSPDVDLVGAFLAFAKPSYFPANVHFFETSRPETPTSKVALRVQYARWLRKLSHRIQPDFEYVRFDPFFCPLVASRRSIIEYNDIFIDQIHFVAARGGWTRFERKIRTSYPYARFIRASERHCFGVAARVVAVTQGLLDHCRSVNADTKSIVIPNASNATFEEDATPDRSDELRLAHVGTLTHWDGLHELVEAIALAREMSPSARIALSITGDGAIREALLRQVADLRLMDAISFQLPVPHDEALALLRGADVVPLLKTIDGYGLSPIKYYEALALGLTVLASNIPHINEVPRFAGRVVAFPLQAPEIAKALLGLYEDRSLLRERRKEIAQHAKESHTWDARVAKLIAALASE